MTITVYRLGKRRYQNELFSGAGGLYADGRWTRRGRAVVYASESIALAVLEYTANYRRRGWVPPSVLGRITIPDGIAIETVEPSALSANWFDPSPPDQLRDIGDDWLVRAEAVALKVPSALVKEEFNYLLNPTHGDFDKLRLGAPEPFAFDGRIGRERKR